MDYQSACIDSPKLSGGVTLKAPETIDEITKRALNALSDATETVNRLSFAIAGSYPERCEEAQPKAIPDGFVSRQEDAMRQVLELSARIYNECSRAMSRLGA